MGNSLGKGSLGWWRLGGRDLNGVECHAVRLTKQPFSLGELISVVWSSGVTPRSSPASTWKLVLSLIVHIATSTHRKTRLLSLLFHLIILIYLNATHKAETGRNKEGTEMFRLATNTLTILLLGTALVVGKQAYINTTPSFSRSRARTACYALLQGNH